MNKPFILVTGNSDKPTSFTGAALNILKSPLLIAWFAENLDFTHPKVIPMPIGLENKQYNGLGQPWKIAQVLQPVVPIYLPNNQVDSELNLNGEKRNTKMERDILSYFNINPRPEIPERWASQILRNISHEPQRKNQTEYAKDLRRSKFVVSPPGVGWDCHRTWESVLFGSIPIVLHSEHMAPLYSQSPVLVVRSWEEVTEDKLKQFTPNTTKRDVVFVDYWLDKIEKAKTAWRKKRSQEAYSFENFSEFFKSFV